jgi:GNAT superfamily N-acetyltransferase
MPLPVLQYNPQPKPGDLIRLFHQSQLEWARHLGEETELDFGRWISNPDLPDSPVANALLDAYLIPGITPPHIADLLVEKRCRCCTINPSFAGNAIIDELSARGWISRPTDILYRQRVVSPTFSPRGDLTIIPARAGYRLYQQLMTERGEIGSSESTDAALLHLDDYHLDMLLALRAGKPVGSIGVLSFGEVGTVRDWYVSESARSTGVGITLLERAMEIAARGILRHVMIGLATTDHTARGLCTAFGFESIGQWVSWEV